MEYKSKYKAEEIEAILDAKNNTGEAVDETLDGLFVDALQTKEVELSESAEITPDEGFLGLKKVTVTVKGGGAPSGGIKVEYIKYDVNAGAMLNTFLIAMALSLRIKYTDETIAFGPKGFLDLMGGEHEVEAVMVSWDDVKAYGLGSQCTLREFLIGNGVSEEELNAIPRITEEQFYTI